MRPSNTVTNPNFNYLKEANTAIYLIPNCTPVEINNVISSMNSSDITALSEGKIVAQTSQINSTINYFAVAIDHAGNSSACSNRVAFIHDNTPPDAPNLVLVTSSPSTTLPTYF